MLIDGQLVRRFDDGSLATIGRDRNSDRWQLLAPVQDDRAASGFDVEPRRPAHHGASTPNSVAAGESVAAAGQIPVVVPGLVDLQVNGFGGQEFSSAGLTVDAVAMIARSMLQQGVTRFFPTVTTNSEAVLQHAVSTVAKTTTRAGLEAEICGIHLEGPFISGDDGPRGAHPRQHVRPPDWDFFRRLQDAAEGRIRLLTLAPELPDAADFIRQATDSGVVVAIGHTAAEASHIAAAVDAGAKLSTHLGNGAHPVLRRHPNYIWSQLAHDGLAASMIADGHHLPAEVLSVFLRVKGPRRAILVSDLSGMAGLSPGTYRTELGEIEILVDGRIVIAGQRDLLAAASAPLWTGVVTSITRGGVGVRDAVDMATKNPAELMSLPPPSLDPNSAAGIVIFPPIDEAPSGKKAVGSDAGENGTTAGHPLGVIANGQILPTIESAES